jgi:hypothetical protein
MSGQLEDDSREPEPGPALALRAVPDMVTPPPGLAADELAALLDRGSTGRAS